MDTFAPTWDRIRPRVVPALVFWPFFGVLVFVVGQVLISTFGERSLLWTQLGFSVLLSAIPLFFVYLSSRFTNMVRELGPLLWADQRECETWLERRRSRVFRLSTWGSRLTTLTIMVLGLLTVLVLGSPFKTFALTAVSVALFAYLLTLCGHGGYACVDLLVTLFELTDRKPSVPFLLLPHPAISQLSTYYLWLTMAAAGSYIVLFVGIFFGPYGLHPWMKSWLSVLAFYPLTLFLLWLFRLRLLNEKIRFSFLSRINAQVQRALIDVEDGRRQDLEELERAIALHSEVRALRTWPLDLQSLLALLVAVLTAAGQVLILTSRIVNAPLQRP